MKIIRVTTELEITTHDWPEGDYNQQRDVITGLIGNGCDLYEHVKPIRLYTEFGHLREPDFRRPGACVSMLVDEEGKYNSECRCNPIASYLYGSDQHGDFIVGNVLFIGEKMEDGEPDFCGIEDSVLNKLVKQIGTIKAMLTLEAARRKKAGGQGV